MLSQISTAAAASPLQSDAILLHFIDRRIKELEEEQRELNRCSADLKSEREIILKKMQELNGEGNSNPI